MDFCYDCKAEAEIFMKYSRIYRDLTSTYCEKQSRTLSERLDLTKYLVILFLFLAKRADYQLYTQIFTPIILQLFICFRLCRRLFFFLKNDHLYSDKTIALSVRLIKHWHKLCRLSRYLGHRKLSDLNPDPDVLRAKVCFNSCLLCSIDHLYSLNCLPLPSNGFCKNGNQGKIND